MLGRQILDGVSVQFEKMNIASVVDKALGQMLGHQRVLITVCGPKSMSEIVRRSAETCRNRLDVDIDVHSEDFDG